MKKSETLKIRLTQKELNRLRLLADIYSGGNVSKWMIYCGLNAPRVFLEDKYKILIPQKKARIPKKRAKT